MSPQDLPQKHKQYQDEGHKVKSINGFISLLKEEKPEFSVKIPDEKDLKELGPIN